MKKLEKLGCGTFLAGRRGYESRFEWAGASRSIGQVAAGEDTPIEANPTADVGDESADELIEHTFRLRPDLSVRLSLPQDLDSVESQRLAVFIRSLPFDPSTPTTPLPPLDKEDFSDWGHGGGSR